MSAVQTYSVRLISITTMATASDLDEHGNLVEAFQDSVTLEDDNLTVSELRWCAFVTNCLHNKTPSQHVDIAEEEWPVLLDQLQSSRTKEQQAAATKIKDYALSSGMAYYTTRTTYNTYHSDTHTTLPSHQPAISTPTITRVFLPITHSEGSSKMCVSAQRDQ